MPIDLDHDDAGSDWLKHNRFVARPGEFTVAPATRADVIAALGLTSLPQSEREAAIEPLIEQGMIPAGWVELLRADPVVGSC